MVGESRSVGRKNQNNEPKEDKKAQYVISLQVTNISSNIAV